MTASTAPPVPPPSSSGTHRARRVARVGALVVGLVVLATAAGFWLSPIGARWRADAAGQPPAVGVTTIDIVDSTFGPASVRVAAGDEAVVLGDGTIIGFVGGQCAEATVREQSLRVLASGRAQVVRGGTVTADGDLDFRGTLGVDKEAPVGFREIRLAFDLDGDLDDEQQATLVRLTERYCVVLQTLRSSPTTTVTIT